MQKRFLLVFVLFLSLIAGCITDSDDNDSGATGKGANASISDYIPLTTEIKYSYERSHTFLEDGEVYSNSGKLISTSIDTQVVYANNTYFAVAEDDDDTTFVRITDNKFCIYGNVGYLNDNELEEYKELPMLDFGADTWIIFDNSGSNALTSLTWTGEYIGRETVTVPAGTFNNCIVFKLFSESYGTSSFGPTTYLWTTTLWYAAGVGMVKSNDYVETIIQSEVHSWDDYTIELTSYNIP